MNDNEDDDALLLAGESLATLRSHFGADDRFLSRYNLFLSLRRQWDASCGARRAGNFLRAVAACALHDQFLSYVLQFHARDALGIVEELALGAVIERDCFARDEFEAVAPVVEALVAAAAVVALTLDSQTDERGQPRDEFERRVQAAIGCVRQRRSALRGVLVLLRSDEESHSSESWRAFEALPFEPDSQLGSTRSGRSRVQTMNGILRQQQHGLRVFLSARDPESWARAADGEVLGEVADRLWGIARDLLAWIEKRRVPDDGLTNNGAGGTAEGNGASQNGGQTPDMLRSEADLEAYLVSSSASPTRETDVSVVDTQLTSHLNDQRSRIQELLEARSSDEESCKVLLSSGLLAAAYDELAAVRDLETLQVQASYLLAYQLEAGRAFAESTCPEALGFERLIQRELNSLTDNGTRMETHLRSLLTLAAFCPRRLIELVVRGAQADSLHHPFYLTLLAACPLLVAWKDQQSQPTGELSVFKCELQRMVNEATSLSGQLEEQSHHAVAFLSGLTGISEHTRANPILPLPELLRDILLAQLKEEEKPPTELPGYLKLFKAFSLFQQLFSHIVTSSSSNLPLLGSSGVELFQRTIEAYASLSGTNTRESLRFREVLLFLAKDMLELFVSDESLPSEALAAALAPTLAGKLCSDAAFTALVAPVNLSDVEAFISIPRKQSGEGDDASSADALTLDQAKRGAETALWRLLWASLASSKLASYAPVHVSELWKSLDNLATWTSVQGDSLSTCQGRVSGASVIQSTVASILLSCGESLTHTFRNNLVPYLMKYETVDVAKRGAETLALPFTRDKSGHPVTDELVCSLMSPHCVARYLVKCWSLVALKPHRENPDVLVEMLRGVIGACDSAVSASAVSPTQLLACLQWECYLAFSARELELDAQSSWPVVSAQLEMSLLRILHGLARFKQLSMEQAAATSGFVAVWLSILPPDGSFASVFRYLQANRDKAR